jgi:hypothetical protein
MSYNIKNKMNVAAQRETKTSGKLYYAFIDVNAALQNKDCSLQNAHDQIESLRDQA